MQGNSEVDSQGPMLPKIALMVLAGSCLLHLQPGLYGPAWTASELLGLLPVVILVFISRPGARLVCGLLLGYLWTLLFAHLYLQHVLPEAISGQDFLVEGEVVGIPEAGHPAVRFNFRVSEYLGINSAPEADYLRLSWYYPEKIPASGDRLRLRVRLKSPHGTRNPGGFDYEKWLFVNGIHATGYVRKSDENQRLETGGASMDRLRQSLQSQIRSIEDARYQGLIQALTLGTRGDISPVQWRLMVETGTSHLMAISGLHIGLVAALVFFLVRRLAPAWLVRFGSLQQVAALVSLGVAGFYALLAGFSIPTQRAFVMLLVIMLALFFRRPAFSLNTLSLAMLAVLLINPLAPLAVGFWLSFLAVLIIHLLVMGRHASSDNRFSRLVQGVRLQWMISLGMLPLTLVLFQQASIVSPLANMLAIPLVGMLVVPLALLASVVGIFSTPLAGWLFSQVSDLLAAVVWLLEQLASWSMASYFIPASGAVAAGLALLGTAILLMPRGWPGRYAGGVLLLPLMFYQPPVPARDEVWLTVLDVGQGLSILVQTSKHSLLYDAGDQSSERFDMGDRVVVPFLRYKGIEQLDRMIISHSDRDHAGGAAAVVSQVKVEQLLGDISRLEDVSMLPAHSPCRRGDHWAWDGIEFRLLHPDRDYRETNNDSCVLQVVGPGFSLLIPGDIEAKVEKKLVASEAGRLSSDVLLLAHHGSNTSTTQAWLEAVRPRQVIVSAGYRNRFRHPAEKVRKRLEEAQLTVLNTAELGAIEVRLSARAGEAVTEVTSWRKVAVHYWNHRF